MPTVYLSVVSLLLSCLYAAYLLFSGKSKSFSDGALLVGLTVAASLEFFDLQAWRHPINWRFWRQGALLAEAVLPSAWLLFSVTCCRTGGVRQAPPATKILLLAAPIFPMAAVLIPFDQFYDSSDFALERMIFLGQAGVFFCLGLVLYLIHSLIQLEHTLTALPRHARWQVKFQLIGVGTLLAIYLFFFSQGVLHRALDMSLLPARSLALGTAVLLMAFSRLRRGEAMGIQVSRVLVFRSVVVLVVACYLFALGLLEKGMRYLDPPVQRALLTMAGLTGGIAVIAFFLSEKVRRKIQVVLHKNFFQNKYDHRDQWLQFTRRIGLARSRRELQQAILTEFGETFAVQDTILFLRDPDGSAFRAAAAHGAAPPGEILSPDNPLIIFFAEREWVFASRDGNEAIWRENRALLERWGVSFIVPLYFDQRLEGFVVLGKPIDGREHFSYEDFDLMKLLAAQAASALSSLQMADQLAETRELAAIGKVSAFILHDLKNLVSSLAMTVENARIHLDNEEFRCDMLLTLDDNVQRMQELIARLQGLEEKPSLDLRPCDLAAVVREGARLAGHHDLVVSGGPVRVRLDAQEMQKVALNLLLNAREAGSGEVRVEVGENGRAWFRVRDEGCGMSEEFIRHSLFRPFATTKRGGIGIGLYQCKHIVEAHGGSIEVASTPGQGTEFTVWLPAAAGAEAPAALSPTPVAGVS